MLTRRSTSVTLAFALAAAVAGTALAQNTSPSSTSGSTGAGKGPSASSATTPSAGRGVGAQGAATADTMPGAGAAAVTGGLPGMSGVVPNRAELASSAFTKLDAGSRGYVTLDEVRQLDGFETYFRQADQNKDGRLNASEFNSAWALYSGTAK